jgi:hypothetical protein
MAKRTSIVNRIVDTNMKETTSTGFAVGHPCGFIANSDYLKSRPKASRAVARYLWGDATFSGDFECMLWNMKQEGLSIPRCVDRHLKHWRAKGCPTWKNNPRISEILCMLWDNPGLATPAEYRELENKAWQLS